MFKTVLQYISSTANLDKDSNGGRGVNKIFNDIGFLCLQFICRYVLHNIRICQKWLLQLADALEISQSAFTCSELTIETQEQGVKYFQS